ncbi:MAG: Fic family protein, partial [Pseudomonadota bacterium]
YDEPDENGEQVLINKFDIRNAEELQKVERRFTAERAREGFPADAYEQSFGGLKAIHGHLFQDLYDWAGEPRRYTTGRGPVPFARPDYIEPFLDKEFAKLAELDHLRGMPEEKFIMHAAHFVNEINAAHPFVDGNGRTQRHWLRLTAETAGYQLVLKSEDQVRYYEACKVGFNDGDETPMITLLAERLLTPKPTLERALDDEQNFSQDDDFEDPDHKPRNKDRDPEP